MTQVLSALTTLALLAGVALFVRHSGDQVSFVETPPAAMAAVAASPAG